MKTRFPTRERAIAYLIESNNANLRIIIANADYIQRLKDKKLNEILEHSTISESHLQEIENRRKNRLRDREHAKEMGLQKLIDIQEETDKFLKDLIKYTDRGFEKLDRNLFDYMCTWQSLIITKHIIELMQFNFDLGQREQEILEASIEISAQLWAISVNAEYSFANLPFVSPDTVKTGVNVLFLAKKLTKSSYTISSDQDYEINRIIKIQKEFHILLTELNSHNRALRFIIDFPSSTPKSSERTARTF